VVREASDIGLTDAVSEHPVATVEVVVAFSFGWCLCSLSGYHCYLLSNSMTTNEHIKRTNVRVEDRGFWDNARDLFCTPVPPSRIQLRKPATGPHIVYLDEVQHDIEAALPESHTGASHAALHEPIHDSTSENTHLTGHVDDHN
jgi:hypothetical protein